MREETKYREQGNISKFGVKTVDEFVVNLSHRYKVKFEDFNS